MHRLIEVFNVRPGVASKIKIYFADIALNIGVGRLRILGGGANSQQAHDVVLTSRRRNDVISTSVRRHVPTRFLINQCQIITFLTVKSDNIETEE